MTIDLSETVRLELIALHHADEIYEISIANREHLRTWLTWVDNMKSVTFIKNFIEGALKQYKEKTQYCYVIIENEKIIGRISVHNIDKQHKIGEFGYWLIKSAEGKGIITLACRELLSVSKEHFGLKKMEIKCGTENLKSQAIPERLGFVLDSIIPKGEFVNGQMIDLKLYVKIL